MVSDGIQLIFNYDFIVYDENTLQVFEDATITVKAYTVTGVGNPSGGTVVFSPDAPDVGQLTILRVIPLVQGVDYTPFDAFPAETHERALDEGIMISQQLAEETSRAIIVPIGGPVDVSYDAPAYDAGKGWMWSESDPKILVTSDDNLNGITTAAQASADAAAVSAGNSATSAGQSSTSADKAEDWATEAEDVPVEPGLFSAFHWAQKAEENAGTGNQVVDLFTAPGDFTPGTTTQLVLSKNATQLNNLKIDFKCIKLS